MKKLFILSTVLMALSVMACLAQSSRPAAPEAIVMGGDDVRFTVLTSGIIRMEWSPEREFVDDASFIFIDRNLPVPEFTTKKNG